jgi:methionine-rich copper-binding protein CopC
MARQKESVMTQRIRLDVAAMAAAMVFAGPALAHPKLVSTLPAANATVAAPKAIQLKFNEKLVPKFTGGALVMTGMPGMASHAPMAMGALPATVGADGKTLILTPKAPLKPGAYTVNWHAVAGDSHRVSGTVAFKVK